MKVSKMRLLREKHTISLDELGHACHMSLQRIHEIEASGDPVNDETIEKVHKGFLTVLAKREAMNDILRTDILKHGDTLLDYVEEHTYEL